MTIRSISALAVVLAPMLAMPAAGQTEPAPPKPIINLGAAANFVVLGISGILNQNHGTTIIENGSLSWNPSGFGTLLGNAGVVTLPTLLSANQDRSNAYAQARTLAPLPRNANLVTFSGTFVPGIYSFAPGLVAGNILLSGAGDFVFQFSGNVSLGGLTVTLSNGASPANVFYVTSGGFTLLGNSTLQGNVLAASSIILDNTAGNINVTGRLLSGADVVFTSSAQAMNNITINGRTKVARYVIKSSLREGARVLAWIGSALP